MNKLAVLAIVSTGMIASHGVSTFAQGPRRFFSRSGGQSNNVYRPNPIYAPIAPPARSSVVVDAQGNHYLSAERYVQFWDARQGRWMLGRTQEYHPMGTIQPQPRVDSQTTKAKGTTPAKPIIHDEFGAALGTNQIGQTAPQGTASAGPTNVPGVAAAQGANQIGLPLTSNNPPLQLQALSPAMTIAKTTQGQPMTSGSPAPPPPTPGPETFYAANLGIYYQQVHYDDGTFGAKLTSAPVAGKPAATLPFDTDDVVFLLNDQRFLRTDDLINHFGQTTVGYIDSSTKSTQSGTITLPPRGS